MPAERRLDFIVIGVQKAGTTSLWQYLRGHPEIAMPEFKEWPVFCASEANLPERLAWFMRTGFAEPPPRALLGHLSNHYMMGMAAARADVETIAARIARWAPHARLLALLRDPIGRAMSQYDMSVRCGLEARPFDVAVEELLAPAGLEAGRRQATETNSYIAQGEYGRILGIYAERFPVERLHVEASGNLERDPGAVLDRILAFLGLPPGYRPEGLGVRHHRGGSRPRIDAEGEAQLRAFMDESVWPRLSGSDAERIGHAFDFFLRTWNVIPDDVLPPLSPRNRQRLKEHYRADAALLGELGVDAPWLAAWADEPPA